MSNSNQGRRGNQEREDFERENARRTRGPQSIEEIIDPRAPLANLNPNLEIPPMPPQQPGKPAPIVPRRMATPIYVPENNPSPPAPEREIEIDERTGRPLGQSRLSSEEHQARTERRGETTAPNPNKKEVHEPESTSPKGAGEPPHV